MATEEKNYAPSAWFREKKFQNGNSIISLQGKTEDLIKWLRDITNEQGLFRATIGKRHKPSDKGLTHCMWQDTWKPTGGGKGFTKAVQPMDIVSETETTPNDKEEDILPF